MGVYGTSCSTPSSKIYPIMYLIAIITLLVVGGLYEGEIIPRNNEYTQKSVWWYGFIGIILVAILLPILNILFEYTNASNSFKTYFWYASHILCYFAVAFVSPGQWPFWLAIGITWELFECYLSCKVLPSLRLPKSWNKYITCSGMYDITANIAGIGIAMLIRSEIPIDGLLKQ